jgi:hypothetical protein
MSKTFDCLYLGSTEAYGAQGQHHVFEVINNLLYNQKRSTKTTTTTTTEPHKVSLFLNDYGLNIIDPLMNHNSHGQKLAIFIGFENICYVCRLKTRMYSTIVTLIIKSNFKNKNLTQLYNKCFVSFKKNRC